MPAKRPPPSQHPDAFVRVSRATHAALVAAQKRLLHDGLARGLPAHVFAAIPKGRPPTTYDGVVALALEVLKRVLDGPVNIPEDSTSKPPRTAP